MILYVIWSREHDAWWRPGRWGYTTNIKEAGHYSLAEAVSITRHANDAAYEDVAILDVNQLERVDLIDPEKLPLAVIT